MQVEIGAELQPAIGMRKRQRSLDVVGDRLARGIGQVVDRKDDHVVAHARPAVFAAVAEECLWSYALVPALRLDVVNMRMLSTEDRRDHLPDVDAILDHRVADRHVLQRDLVSQRYVLHALECQRSVFVEDQPGQLHAGRDALDDHDRDRIRGSCSTQWIMGFAPEMREETCRRTPAMASGMV